MPNYIALAIPAFFVLIALELIVAAIQKKRYYRFNDSISDLSCGMVNQVADLFIKLATFPLYYFLLENFSIWKVEANVWSWVAIFFGVDFCYYWFHRASHRVNFLWASHIVHHQSEEYNLSVALRQAAFNRLIAFAFYTPLAVLGFPFEMYFAMVAFSTLYQFWIHTRTIDKLGVLEWFLNTPSHHRVHHGRNPRYLDKNYAATLIIWDRLFGTFAEEIEEPSYGITEPLQSWNPIWANLHYFCEIGKASFRAKNWFDKIGIWFRPPEWKPISTQKRVGQTGRQLLDQEKYDRVGFRGISQYVVVHYIITILLLLIYLDRAEVWTLSTLSQIGGIVIWGLLNFGGLFERKRWVLFSESFRLTAFFFALNSMRDVSWSVQSLTSIFAFVALVSVFWLIRDWKAYFSKGSTGAAAFV